MSYVSHPTAQPGQLEQVLRNAVAQIDDDKAAVRRVDTAGFGQAERVIICQRQFNRSVFPGQRYILARRIMHLHPFLLKRQHFVRMARQQRLDRQTAVFFQTRYKTLEYALENDKAYSLYRRRSKTTAGPSTP